QAQCGANLTLYDQLDFQERGVVITFFKNTITKKNTAIFEEFKANLDQFQTRGIGVIGITDAPPEKNMTFAQSLGIEGREIIIFYDKNGKTGQDYGVYSGTGTLNLGYHETAYFLLNKEGVIQFKHTGSVLDAQTQTLLEEIDRM
ncbi:MAG: redoxin domain-containing protein, partial [Desulfatitalea sp.]|nr:peroxiredoxin family protein [Desulfatitalea sp.]NNK02658.1 redoxin domain-containing protein [Desulfatitalea sp.]